jgi:hypothetical protein
LVSFSGLNIPVQRGFGDLEGLANIPNGVSFLVELKGNTALFRGQDFGSAAFSPSGTGSSQSCLCPLPDQISLKFRKRFFPAAIHQVPILGPLTEAQRGWLHE